jgi:hypothetical protein
VQLLETVQIRVIRSEEKLGSLTLLKVQIN